MRLERGQRQSREREREGEGWSEVGRDKEGRRESAKTAAGKFRTCQKRAQYNNLETHKVVSQHFVVVIVELLLLLLLPHGVFILLLLLLLPAAPSSSVRCSASMGVREISINYLTSCCQQREPKHQQQQQCHMCRIHTHTHTHSAQIVLMATLAQGPSPFNGPLNGASHRTLLVPLSASDWCTANVNTNRRQILKRERERDIEKVPHIVCFRFSLCNSNESRLTKISSWNFIWHFNEIFRLTLGHKLRILWQAIFHLKSVGKSQNWQSMRFQRERERERESEYEL